MIVSILVVLAVLALVLYLIFRPKPLGPLPELENEEVRMLQQYVRYYRDLDQPERKRFIQRMRKFLQLVKITGIETEVEPLDKVLIAASAVIPTFGFPQWNQYPRLNEVLLYHDHFRHGDFATEGTDRRIAGMVGGGFLNGKLLLARPSLRAGFVQHGPDNTGIHEFAHLLDKADGDTDGIPEYFLTHEYLVPWVEMIRRESEDIRKRRSNIDPYALTNQAEFFAVAAEYFFNQPQFLARDHPELFGLLEEVFNQDMDGDGVVGPE